MFRLAPSDLVVVDKYHYVGNTIRNDDPSSLDQKILFNAINFVSPSHLHPLSFSLSSNSHSKLSLLFILLPPNSGAGAAPAAALSSGRPH